jgi:hypothetical protein
MIDTAVMENLRTLFLVPSEEMNLHGAVFAVNLKGVSNK